MISKMDRKATFFNPTVTKSSSGGTTNSYLQWGQVWCEYRKKEGRLNTNGSQSQHAYDIELKLWYSDLIGANLSKDTKVTVGGLSFNVVDFEVDERKPLVIIKAVSRV
jgi:SPP1 family predicted phage head-tail adaptor